jgi:hypothetical protein
VSETKKGKPRKKRADAYTLETPTVEATINFYATPRSLRPPELRKSVDFARSLGLKSEDSLRAYTGMPGFWPAVRAKFKQKMGELNHLVDLSLFEKTQTRIAKTIKKDLQSGKREETVEERDADTHAIKLFKEVYDGYEESLNLKHSFAAGLKKAAERARKAKMAQKEAKA